MSAIPIAPAAEPWRLPSRGRVAMLALITGESAIFTIFVVAYIFYIGKSLTQTDAAAGSRNSVVQHDLPAVEQCHHPARRTED